jgi:hypothetical protein
MLLDPIIYNRLALQRCEELQREVAEERMWNRLCSHTLNRVQHHIWTGLLSVTMIGILLLTSLPLVPVLPSTVAGISTAWFNIVGLLVGAMIFVRAGRAYRAAGYLDPTQTWQNRGMNWGGIAVGGLIGVGSDMTHAYELRVVCVVIINILLIIAFTRCLAALHRLRMSWR